MTRARIRYPTAALVAILLGMALVFIRSAVWILWPQSYFDSDQAIYGLMAKHITEGRAFPVFMYGQNYNLAVEAWLAAPLFAILGPSVLALKLPLLGVNLAIVALLIHMLIKDGGVRPAEAFVASAFFAVAPPLASSRLLEVSGGNIEPLIYPLILWLLRRRPVLLGVVAGVGIVHRELTWYAIAALVAIEAWQGTLMTRTRRREWGTTAGTLAGVVLVFSGLARLGPVLGPGTVGLGFDPLQIRRQGLFGCLQLAKLPGNFDWVATRNLAAVFGWRPDAPDAFKVDSHLMFGHAWILWPLGCLSVLVILSALFRPRARAENTNVSHAGGHAFVGYLIIVGLESAIAHATLSCNVQQPVLIRYTLLALFATTGMTAWIFQRQVPPIIRATVVACVMLWASASMWDTTRLLREYAYNAPEDRVGQLIAYLDAHRIRFGRGSYWTAYVVDFRSNERITVAATKYSRIETYQRLVDGQPQGAVAYISSPPCVQRAAPAGDWCVDRERP